MKLLLSKKVAVVTGGARGIGRAIAMRLLQEGASVVIFDLNSQEEGDAICKEILTQVDGNVVFKQVNVSVSDQIKNALDAVYQEFGQIDILVNNAGITRDNLLMRLSEQEWDQVMNVNLKSVYDTCRLVIRHMMKAKSGKIINIASVVGLIGNPGQTNYAASKAGMIGFSKALAKEVGSRNICVNCIAPGFIETPMTKNLSEKQKEILLSQISMQRLGQPEDVANAVLFLASSLSDYVNGHVLTVDGGMVMY